MKSKYTIGALGSIIFAISGIIYTISRHANYYVGTSLKLFINSFYDAALRSVYVFIGIGIILMGIQVITIYNDNKISIAPFTFFLSLLSGIFIFIAYPLVLFPQGNRFSFFPSGGNFINFVLFVISNILTTFFFIFYSQVLNRNAEYVANKQFIRFISPVLLIFGLAYAVLTVVIGAIINSLRMGDFFTPMIIFSEFMFSVDPWTGEGGNTSGFILMIILDYWHYPNGNVIGAYFLLWFVALIPLSFLNLINGFNFLAEEGAMEKQVKKIEKRKDEIESDVVELIGDISSKYGGITIQRLSAKLGYNPSVVKSVIKDLINQNRISGKLRGNLLIFEKRRISIPTTRRAVVRPYEKRKGIIVKRGGDIQGGKYNYKIKVENNTDYNITDIIFQIISYPEDSIELVGDLYREIQKLDAGGLVSPSFEFLPTKDCIVGTIHSTVTYIDYLNKPHTINVEPYTISMICGLLSPKQIDVSKFTSITEELLDFSKAGEEIRIPYNASVIYEKLKTVLPDHNFWFVTRPEERVLGDMFIGEFNGFAQGKYNHKEVGLKITITGEKNGYSSIGMIEVYGQDRSMLPPLISELSKKIIIWNCPKCNAPLRKEDVEKLLNNQLVECHYCAYMISKLL
ncbi:MAG: hypothetical protein ACFFCM_11645 [Promethearchaeota archaeon]